MLRFKFFLVIMCAAVFAGGSVKAQDSSVPAFFSAVEDLPLMPGLVELPQDALSFDKPEGRIIEAYALLQKAVLRSKVEEFYKSTLPQFGWGYVKGNQYYRSGEHLDLSFGHSEQQEYLKITIRPVL